MQVHNIVFDLGGVFLDIDYTLTREAFTRLGVADFDTLYAQQKASPLFEKLETGHLSPEEFYQAFREATGLTTLTDNKIEDAWNAMLGGFPAERIEWLKKIKTRYRIYLYSNTNQIHHTAFMKLYRQLFPELPPFDSFFIRACYSHELGLRKPYPESYTALMQQEGLIPAETLFIDDTIINIEGAALAGMQTHWLRPGESVLQLNL